jgi:DNA-binding response OmpR family regulator
MGTEREPVKGRILVGESNAGAAQALTEALAAEGYDVCVARDAGLLPRSKRTRGISGTSTRSSDGEGLVPFDVIVWGMDGRTPPVQDERRLSDPSVARALILVSGAGRLATAVEAERLGATAILARPVDPAELFRAVETALGNA